MMISGLLWYDDDTRRPLAQKVAEAAERYRERVGYEPTTCQLNPSLMPSADQTRPKRALRQSVGPSALSTPLRLEPNEHLRPNYFYVGVLAGERLKRAASHRVAPRTAGAVREELAKRDKPDKKLKAS